MPALGLTQLSSFLTMSITGMYITHDAREID